LTLAEKKNYYQQKHQRFPHGPDDELTPGTLCDSPSEFRYPERIPYCKRNLETQTKRHIIKVYDQVLGFEVGQMNRMDFKIDHLIPLCAGGSNDEANLWPQHKSVYEITDPLEPEICNKMAQGRLKQAEAVNLILEAKTDLDKAPEILKYIQSL